MKNGRKRLVASETIDPLAAGTKKLDTLIGKAEKTKTVLEQISGIPEGIEVKVRPGAIDFKIDNEEVSFKCLADEIRSKFRVTLDKDFNENKGNYVLVAKADGVIIKIVDIPAPATCVIKMEEIVQTKKKKRFLPFGECESIIK